MQVLPLPSRLRGGLRVLALRLPRPRSLYGPLRQGKLHKGGLLRYPCREQRSAIHHLCRKCRPRYDAVRAAALPTMATYHIRILLHWHSTTQIAGPPEYFRD